MLTSQPYIVEPLEMSPPWNSVMSRGRIGSRRPKPMIASARFTKMKMTAGWREEDMGRFTTYELRSTISEPDRAESSIVNHKWVSVPRGTFSLPHGAGRGGRCLWAGGDRWRKG